MKLISKTHDYYDTALAQGQDASVVYVRERSEGWASLPEDTVPWAVPTGRRGKVGVRTVCVTDTANHTPPRYSYWGRDGEGENRLRFDEAFVAIAGRAHPVWVRWGTGPEWSGERTVQPGDRIADTSLESLEAWMLKRQQAKGRALAKAPVVETQPARRDEDDIRAYEHARERFLAADFTELHLAQGAPVLLLAHPDTLAGQPVRFPAGNGPNVAVIRNPVLADLGLQRTLDPFACFQAIAQFVGGVVPGRQMPMVEISDRSKIDKHGFDPAYGFRRRPAGR